MAYMSVISPCYACRQLFSYHPDRVPSIRVDGIRQPICQSCVDRANVKRKENGLPPIVPLPGAYEPEECA